MIAVFRRASVGVVGVVAALCVLDFATKWRRYYVADEAIGLGLLITLVILIALGILLYFFIPRIPETSQGGFVSNRNGHIGVDGSYTMSGYIPINITSANYYPIYVRYVSAIAWPSGTASSNQVANGSYSSLSINARALTSFNFPLDIHMTPTQASNTNMAVACAAGGVPIDYSISIYLPFLEAFNYIIIKTGSTSLTC